MDLRDTPSQQLRDHIDLLRKRFTWTEPPPPQFLEEMALEMREHALFLESFLLPKVADPTVHLASLRVIRGVGAGEALVHPQERMRVYGVESNGAEEPEPEPAAP